MCECDVSAGWTGFTDIIGFAADCKFSRAAKLRKSLSCVCALRASGYFCLNGRVVCSKRLRLDFYVRKYAVRSRQFY